MTTKANVTAPPRKRQSSLIESFDAAPAKTADNMKAVKPKDLSFKVDPQFHYQFRNTAAKFDISMRRLLEEAFYAWAEKQALTLERHQGEE